MRNGVADIETSSIICDPRCQSRVGIDLALVQEYADVLKDDGLLPLMSTIKAEEGYYLYDGFHRLEAYRIAGQPRVRVEFRDGDVWDAIERSCAVNTKHGKRRTPGDTTRAVETILKVMDHRGEKWSQGEIAERCAITQPRVSQILRDNPSYKDLYDGDESFTLVRRRNGVAYEMDTRNIGKRPDLTIDKEWAHEAQPGETPAPAPFKSARAQQRAWLASVRGGDADDFDDAADEKATATAIVRHLVPGLSDLLDYDRPPSTPKQCQAVVTALEALLLTLQRPEYDGHERVMLTEVIEYLTTHTEFDNQKWMLTELRELRINIDAANGAREDALAALRQTA